MDTPQPITDQLAPGIPWETRLQHIVETMREMSLQTDPQRMVRAYGERMSTLMPLRGIVAISRRGLDSPWYRVTRFSGWEENINPWKQQDRLPLLSTGLLGELLYAEQPQVIEALQIDEHDASYPYLGEAGSIMAIPQFDQGRALNMVVFYHPDRGVFRPEMLPDTVWVSNLFGRATHNLVLTEEVKQAYRAVDHELKMVADIQRSLLPAELPRVPRLDLAAHYQTSRRAGGDYYDFFPLDKDRWGILIADVSGHGTPAAVIMAITHALAHGLPGPQLPPSELLNRINRHLAQRYTADSGTFVTAFYGVFDPATRVLEFASAGHPAPRLKRCVDGSIYSVDGQAGLPLGIEVDVQYSTSRHQLVPGDQLVFYTDGITEARNPAGEFFGLAGLDRVLGRCRDQAGTIIDAVLAELDQFTARQPADDDRTLLVARVV
ncbi:MAG: PP2C family protein-serine/threonine phosphatase [Pirellulales bacterium]|nr:PP2C family protein-serine/threonine phosphatase [Pirellulales bacterium]